MSSKYPNEALKQQALMVKFSLDMAEALVYNEIFPQMKVNSCKYSWWDLIHTSQNDALGAPTTDREIEHRSLIPATNTAVSCYSNIPEFEESSWYQNESNLEYFSEQIALTECCVSSCEPLPENISEHKIREITERTQMTLNRSAILKAFNAANYDALKLPTAAAVVPSMAINSAQGAVIDGLQFLDNSAFDVVLFFNLINMTSYTTGARNKMFIDGITAIKLQRHPKVIEAIATGCSVPGTISIDQVATALEFEKIVVIKSVANSALIGSPAQLDWIVKNKILLTVSRATTSQELKQVNFGHTAYKTGYLTTILSQDNKVAVGQANPFGVDYFAVYHDYSPTIKMIEAGTLITNVYA